MNDSNAGSAAIISPSPSSVATILSPRLEELRRRREDRYEDLDGRIRGLRARDRSRAWSDGRGSDGRESAVDDDDSSSSSSSSEYDEDAGGGGGGLVKELMDANRSLLETNRVLSRRNDNLQREISSVRERLENLEESSSSPLSNPTNKATKEIMVVPARTKKDDDGPTADENANDDSSPKDDTTTTATRIVENKEEHVLLDDEHDDDVVDDDATTERANVSGGVVWEPFPTTPRNRESDNDSKEALRSVDGKDEERLLDAKTNDGVDRAPPPVARYLFGFVICLVIAVMVPMSLSLKKAENDDDAPVIPRAERLRNALLSSGLASDAALSDAASPESRALAWWTARYDRWDADCYVVVALAHELFEAEEEKEGDPPALSDVDATVDATTTTERNACCDWDHVVSCDNDENVVGVDLSRRWLEGTSSFERVVSLAELRELDLSDNRLWGAVPSTLLRRTPSLRVLDLSRNDFTSFENDDVNGTGTTTTSLTTLVLDGNPLHGVTLSSVLFLSSDRRSRLPSLRELSCRDCGLTGPLPILPAELTEVRLSSNRLTSKVAAELLWGTNRLRVLDLDRNRLTGTIPGSPGGDAPTRLEELYLSGNADLTGTIPSGLLNSPSLATLSLSDCALTGTIPASPEDYGVVVLERVLLDRNALTGTVPASLFAAGGDENVLVELDLADNALTGPVLPASVQRWPRRLARVDVSGNRLSGTLPASLGTSALSLIGLSIDSNANATGPLPTSLGGPSGSLRSLRACGTGELLRNATAALERLCERNQRLIVYHEDERCACCTDRYCDPGGEEGERR